MTDFLPESYRVLTVDDSRIVLNLVENVLNQAGFRVQAATSGEEALDYIRRSGLPHLAIVDINMPLGMDGFAFCEAVHEFSDLPVIMLTVVEEEETIIQAIEEHAEDYITKPFNSGELVARVRRVLLRIGDFAYPLNALTKVDERLTVDFPGCQIIVDGKPISLTPTETKLLYILMRSAGRTLTTDYLLRRLWPLDGADERGLRVYIHRLRSKIESSPMDPGYILSQRGKGYVFVEPEALAAE